MLMRARLLIGVLVLILPGFLSAENVLMQVYQPTSLLGTELDGDPLGTGKNLAATIVSRPILVGGAFPESVVEAVALPHRIAGSGKDFPQESNLIVLVGGRLEARHRQGDRNEHVIIADFSKAEVPDNLGLTLLEVMKVTALCLQKTLGDRHEIPLRITWLIPEASEFDTSTLPTLIGSSEK